MKTAIDVLRSAVERCNDIFNNRYPDIAADFHFESGYTATIQKELDKLQESDEFLPYPLFAVFTEGMTEIQHQYYVEFSIPKISVAMQSVQDATERQRLDTNFKQRLYLIAEIFEDVLREIHFGYDLNITRHDVPFYTETNSVSHKAHNILDGFVIQNLKMKVLQETNCEQ